MLDPSFYPVFLSSDIATQKMFALVAALAHDTLFFDFVYEVVREKMILGVDELTDADIRVFFKGQAGAKRESSSLSGLHAASAGSGIQNAALRGRNAGRKQGSSRKILRPILDIALERWLQDNGYAIMVNALTGVR